MCIVNLNLLFFFSLLSNCHWEWYALVYSQKFALKPAHLPQGFSSASPYTSSGVPSSMCMGMPPYGPSMFNGSSVHPFNMPFSGGSMYLYNFGNRLSTGSPYRKLPLSGPAPYPSGSMVGSGTNTLLILFFYFLFLWLLWTGPHLVIGIGERIEE